MKVTHVVNNDIGCGYAEYARELDAELKKEFDSSITLPGQDVGDVDVIIASYGSFETLCLTPQQTEKWRAEGKKVVLLHRESTGDLTEGCTIPVKHFLGHVDAIVTHEPTNYGTEFIPISFVEVDNLPEPDERFVIGEAGFYDPMKHFETVIDVARAAGAFVNLTIAHYWRTDPAWVRAAVDEMKKKAIKGDEIEMAFLPLPRVIRRLARSTVNMFWHHPSANCSQSTSVGMAIASKRPVLISGNRRFLVMQTQYADEIYVAQEREDAIRIVKEIWEAIQNGKPVRTPKRLYEAYSWRVCGETYRKLIYRVAKG